MEYCYYKFKYHDCRYEGPAKTCNKTRENCQLLDNFHNWPRPSKTSFIVEGPPLTHETIIIAALVRRLGGSVYIPDEELSLITGLVIVDKDGGLNINV